MLFGKWCFQNYLALFLPNHYSVQCFSSCVMSDRSTAEGSFTRFLRLCRWSSNSNRECCTTSTHWEASFCLAFLQPPSFCTSSHGVATSTYTTSSTTFVKFWGSTSSTRNPLPTPNAPSPSTSSPPNCTTSRCSATCSASQPSILSPTKCSNGSSTRCLQQGLCSI